jgi:YHS domain-containing protein
MNNNTKLLSAVLVLSIGLGIGCANPSTSSADVERIKEIQSGKPMTSTQGGLAVRGYDPVAYFTENQPVEGNSQFAYDWQGATWHFASAKNRDLFTQNPAKYAPQYGGYCAWAVKKGGTAPSDPQAWKIVNGKLYLNFDANVQAQWQQDIPGNIAKADQNWPAVLKK